MSIVKEQLYIQCKLYIKNKETEIKKAIAEAQEAANEDTKSSAGDKFETGREIMQQEIDLNLARLNELKNQQTALDHVIPAQTNTTASAGSLVYTNNGNYYIAISAGKLKIDDTTFYAISPESPIGLQMEGKTAGHEFSINGKNIRIDKVL